MISLFHFKHDHNRKVMFRFLFQGEMGPKGERGSPGSIIWNGLKVKIDSIHSMHPSLF